LEIQEIRDRIRRSVAEFGELPLESVDGETQLVGESSALKSGALVEVLLDMEEFAEEELHVEFDWRSDSAMSQSRSIFRTVETLARHLHQLQG
jgi:hypothetical protein